MPDQVYDPNRRMTYAFSEGDGGDLVIDVDAEAGADIPPHLHPSMEERWTVRQGRVRFKVGGKTLEPEPGETITVPPRTRHSVKVLDPDGARMQAVAPDGGKGLRGFLEEAAAMGQEGVITRRGVVKSLGGAKRAARLIDANRVNTVILFPPPFVQRIMFAPLLRN